MDRAVLGSERGVIVLPVADVEFPLAGILLLEHRVGVEGTIGLWGWTLALASEWWYWWCVDCVCGVGVVVVSGGRVGSRGG